MPQFQWEWGSNTGQERILAAIDAVGASLARLEEQKGLATMQPGEAPVIIMDKTGLEEKGLQEGGEELNIIQTVISLLQDFSGRLVRCEARGVAASRQTLGTQAQIPGNGGKCANFFRNQSTRYSMEATQALQMVSGSPSRVSNQVDIWIAEISHLVPGAGWGVDKWWQFACKTAIYSRGLWWWELRRGESIPSYLSRGAKLESIHYKGISLQAAKLSQLAAQLQGNN